MKSTTETKLGEVLRQQRISAALTLHQLAKLSKVSASHLGRIERGERFPSATILRKIARPLGFEENELFVLAGYLSPYPSGIAEAGPSYSKGHLAPYVARMLSEEPVEVQHAVVGILSILKSIAKSLIKETA